MHVHYLQTKKDVSVWMCVQIQVVNYVWPVVCLFVGVCVFHMGERAPQDRVWPALPTSDVQGEEASVWAVRQGAGRRGEAGKTSETPRKEGLIPSTSWGGQAPWKVSTCKIKEDVVWSQELGISCQYQKWIFNFMHISLRSLCFLATFVLFLTES